MSDLYWYEAPAVLWQLNRWKEFWPRAEMSDIEQHNAIMRFSIYLAILLAVFYQSLIPSLIVVAVAVLSMMNFQPHASSRRSASCSAPTAHNPYMNVSMADRFDQQYKPPACFISPAEQEEQIGYRDVDDLFDRKHSFRTFHTQPDTEYPNDHSKYLKYMYPMPQTCKEDSANCNQFFELLQAKRQM